MGELTTLGFQPGTSPLHRLDPRTKQLLVMVLGVTCLGADSLFLAAASLVLFQLFHLAGLRFFQFIKNIRYFLVFLCCIFVVRILAFGDNYYPVIVVDSVKEAALVCWRLLLVVLMGVLLIVTTRTADIRAALIWFLRPIPFINERLAATMVGLVVRLLPLVLHQAKETGEAMRARGVEKRRNPLVRLTQFSITLFRRVFARADDLADSMQARCYNEHRTLPLLAFAKGDCVAAGITILLLSVVLIP
ncbi:MAG: energy-coupling factor transporter transmembrane component T [Desulfocapsaceae bacterium]|nr:energy-coupling factor transporter transmembrane component T [Desulfocapsaceae bacterium]